jgi:signal transduction histidine kinase
MDKALPAQDLKNSFFEYNRSFRISSSKVGCMLVVVLMPAGLTLDYFVYPQKLGLFLSLRIICSLLALALWGLLSTSFGRRHFRILGMGWFILPSLFISLMIYFEDGVNSSYYAGLNLVLIAISWVAQVDFLETVIASLLTLAMYCTACFANGPVTASVLFNNLYFIVLTGIIVVTGSYYVNRLRFREFALRTEVDSSRKELERSNLKLVEMDRAKSEFFANISHELRTPLTLLIGPLERLRTESEQSSLENRRMLLDIMYGNSLRLLRLINDLLSLVRLDSGALVLRKTKVALGPFVEGLTNSVAPMAEQCQLTFETKIQSEEGSDVYIDRDKFEKIVFNLLFNAFKFTPKGGEVSLSVTVKGPWLELVVKDTGVGISPQDLERIFDRFWQAEGSTTRRYQGVGIGLALVKDLARVHGGDVTAESELNRGTSMKVRLDVSAAAEEKVSVLEQDPIDVPAVLSNGPDEDWLNRLYRRAELFPAHVVGSAENKPADIKDGKERSNVLIVDDEPDMRRFLGSQLNERYNVFEVSNGIKAIEEANKRDFNLVLLDYMMPDMDGLEVMQRLKGCSGTKTTPVIILTARADEDFKIKTLAAGATDFLTKPFSSTELSVRAHNMIAARQLQKQVEAKTYQLEKALEQIKETETQLVHQAKMASLGQLSAGLMHEINNPLNFANTALHILKKRLTSVSDGTTDKLSKPLTDIQDGISRVVAITSSLRSFTHPDDSTFSRIDLSEIIGTALRFVQADSREIEVQLNLDESAQIWGNPNQLVHLIINLLQNSIDSLQRKNFPPKQIRLDTKVKGKEIEVSCYDNGEGISADYLDKIFDAFFTTKKVGEGVGLGLNICHRIMTQHHGKIEVESIKNQFCRFTLTFPQYNPSVAL